MRYHFVAIRTAPLETTKQATLSLSEAMKKKEKKKKEAMEQEEATHTAGGSGNWRELGV